MVKRSLDAGNRNATRLHEYTSTKRVDERQIDPDGSVRSAVVKTYGSVIVDGVMVRKLIEKDDKPLPQAEARKEDERARRVSASRKHESASDKEKRLAEQAKKRVKQQEFNQEILEAFDFRLIGEELIAARKNWVVEATPRPGYRPKELRAQVFPHLQGKIWIDQEDHLWTKADAVAIGQISVGFGIVAKLEPGAHLYFEQIRMPEGVWLLHNSGIRAVAHVAIVKRIGIEQVSRFDDYRKVPPGVNVVEDSAGN